MRKQKSWNKDTLTRKLDVRETRTLHLAPCSKKHQHSSATAQKLCQRDKRKH
ncbi:MYB and HSA domain-containing protein [Sesbania bispinosa]|nr:MYB and HSA domain-containing protein [Sesbania bispinosa]